jgi:hypothetical protein
VPADQLSFTFTAVDDLPEGFRFHDLRHFYGSTLIASGLDIKTVQTRMRHASAKTTLDCYGHMLPDRDDATRAAIGSAITARSDSADFCGLERRVTPIAPSQRAA